MEIDELDALCLGMKGTEKVIQWMGAHVYKVGGKVFAILAPEAGRLTLKCDSPDKAEMLIEAGIAERAPHLPRGGWAAFRGLEGDDLRSWVTESYDAIKASLTKKKQAEIDAS